MYRLLVADDEIEFRNSLCNYYPWSQIGFEVVKQASDGTEVIDYISSNHVDVILCDIKMPIMDGIDVARELYNSKSRIKMIFISGYRDFEYMQQAMQYGVKNYILKPTKYNEITKVFSQLKDELDKENKRDESIEDDLAHDDYRIRTVLSYISSFPGQATLESCAGKIRMNPSYFSSFFEKHMGQSFSKYMTYVKMTKAADMLRLDMGIMNISSILGYSSTKSFSRAFMKYWKVTPSEYRIGKEPGND